MCGFAGFIDPRRGNEANLRAQARTMADTISHRGPDDSGEWVDGPAGYAVGHRRLAVIDLSPLGHQPMISPDGRYVLAYNGEVYNFVDLRGELEGKGYAFQGHSDTEVILAAWSHWGAVETTKRLIGMFAIAMWDREARTLTLVRDRLGIKPLYWGRFGELFVFGSEIKALRAHGGWTARLDRGALAAYMRHVYVPGPGTIYEGVHKLTPGTILTLAAGGEPRTEYFWRLDDVVVKTRTLDLSDAEAADRLEAVLGDAVEKRMVADVPLGAFLSGGIDSSAVVALMQARARTPVKTFSIGFHEEGYNEAGHAMAVAKHLGTDHTELYVEPAHALSVIPRLADMYDEPFADSSQVPVFLVSELAREHVTVSLSGDGGDELFGGYNRYLLANRMWGAMARLPRPLRTLAASSIRTLSPTTWDRVAAVLPSRFRFPQTGDKLHKLSGILGARDADDLYRRIITHWDDPSAVVVGADETKGLLWDEGAAARIPELSDRMRYWDALTYLPDDILAKVDRASMAVGLEARVPILDHRVVEFAWSLPQHQLVRGGESKWLLRQVLHRHVPRELIERPKMGFGVPIDHWLRGPLRDWAEELLDQRRLKEEGVFDPAPVRQRWAEHLSGRRNWQYHLWAVLMFQDWFARWKPSLA